MDIKKHKSYTKEFKWEAVKLAKELGSACQAAKGLGIANSTLCKWVNEFKADGQDAFPGKGRLKPEDEELRQLRAKVKRLEMEKAILKKAITFFGERMP